MRRNLINNWTDIPLVSNFDFCPLTFYPPVINFSLLQWRQRSMGAVVAGGAIYDTLDMPMKHYLNQFTLKELLQNQSLDSLGTSDDVLYQQYKQTMQGSQTANLLKIQDAFANEQHDTAAVWIAQLPNTDTLLQWNKTVESIWNQSILNDTTISAIDSATLYTIACMNPLEIGSAVYQSRAILDWNGCEQLPILQARSNNPTPSGDNATVLNTSIYPNPTNGSFSIKSNKEMNAIAIHDLSGKLMLKTTITGTVYECNSTLERGVYITTITFEDGTNETHKIVVD